jgi:hypothetical protein
MTQTVTTHERPSAKGSARSPAAAALAAFGFVVEGVIAVTHATGDNQWDALSQALNIAFIVACVALVGALPAVGRLLAPTRFGRVGTVVAQVGYAAMAIESIASGVHGGNTLGIVFVLGLGLSLLGLLALAVAGLIDGALRWAAALPLLGMLVGIAGGDHGASIVLGAVWAGFAVLLAKRAE